MVLKVSVQVHRNSWHRKYRLNDPKVQSSVVMHPVFKTVAPKARRDKYEGMGVSVGQ